MKNNVEKKLREYYKSEAEALRMPPESEIKALSVSKTVKRNSVTPRRFNRFATIGACCVVFMLVLAAFPLLNRMTPVTPPVDDNSAISNTGDTGIKNPPVSQVTNPGTSSTPGTDSSGTNPPVTVNYPNLSLLSISEWLSDSDVVWSSSDGVKGNEATGINIERGTVRITDELRAKMEGQDKDTVYAVMVDFSSAIVESEISAWKYDGKTIAELEAELVRLRSESKIIGNNTATGPDGVTIELPIYDNAKELAIAANLIREARRNYYFKCLEDYNESFKSMGLGIYNEKEGYTIENMIFYTFATKAQLENFDCKTTEAFVFTTAIRFK